MKKFAVLLAVAITAVGAATAIAGSTPWVKTGKTSLGTVLTNAHGRTLYMLNGETKSKLLCKSSSCTSNWPPLMASGKALAAGGAKTSSLGTIARGSGKQVTYNGHPVYTFAGDTKAGQATGEAVKADGGTWYAVSPKGTAMTASAGSTSGGSTGTGW